MWLIRNELVNYKDRWYLYRVGWDTFPEAEGVPYVIQFLLVCLFCDFDGLVPPVDF